jgi:hypothetical protein
MAKEYRIHIRGKQREIIDADLMAQLVVMLGRKLAQDAKEAAEVAREAQEDAELDQGDEDQVPGRETGGLA